MPRLLTLSLFLLFARTQVQAQLEEFVGVLQDSTFSGAKSVILNEEHAYEVHSLNSATIGYRGRYLILDSDHAFLREHAESYDDDTRITRFEMSSEAILGEGKEKARRGDFTDERVLSDMTFHQDLMRRSVSVPCESYPCIVELETERKVRDFAMMGFPNWYPQLREQGVVRAAYTATVPVDNELLYDLNQLPEPTITEEGNNRIYRWEVTQLPPQEHEPYAPPESTTLPYLRVGLKNFEVEDFRGSFADWASFGSFIDHISAGRNELPDRLKVTVHELVEGIDDPHEKIERLYNFMQQRMRYVGIQLGLGGWQPFPASYVEQNRYGDCKALSNYMGALLKEVGIPSYLVLIYSGDDIRYDVKEQFATSAFNHMVLYLPEQDMYLECTSKNAPTGYMSEDTRDRNVIWITPEGGKLARMPALLPADHGHVRSVDLYVNENKSVGFSTRGSFFGGAQETFRAVAAYWTDRSDQLEWLHGHDYLPDVSGTDFDYIVHDDKPEVDIIYATTLYNYARGMGRRTFVPVNPYPREWIPEAIEERRLPIEMSTARMFVDTVRIHIPDNMEVEAGGSGELSLTHQAGDYLLKVTPTEDGLEWVRIFKIKPVSLPAEAYDDLREFYTQVSKAERGQLVLREKRTK